jgi:hypothetical protein
MPVAKIAETANTHTRKFTWYRIHSFSTHVAASLRQGNAHTSETVWKEISLLPRTKPRSVGHPSRCLVIILCYPSSFRSFVINRPFLGAFAKLRRATISFLMSIRLSVRMEQLGFHLVDFDETWYFSFFSKMLRKTSCLSNMQKRIILYMKMFSHLWQYLAELFAER